MCAFPDCERTPAVQSLVRRPLQPILARTANEPAGRYTRLRGQALRPRVVPRHARKVYVRGKGYAYGLTPEEVVALFSAHACANCGSPSGSTKAPSLPGP